MEIATPTHSTTGEHTLSRTRKVQLTAAHVARAFSDQEPDKPLQYALQDAGYSVAVMAYDYTRMTGPHEHGAPRNAESIRYRHSPELDRLIRDIESGRHMGQVTILISDKERRISFREHLREEETQTTFTVPVPDNYMPGLHRLAKDQGVTTEHAVKLAVRRAVLQNAVHLPMPGCPGKTLCLMAEHQHSKGTWETAAPEQRCPECAHITDPEPPT